MLQPQTDSALEVRPPGTLRPSAGCVRPRLPPHQAQRESTVREGGRPAAPQRPQLCWQGQEGLGRDLGVPSPLQSSPCYCREA